MTPRLLVIDDEAQVRRVLERLLEHLGCEVLAAGDGESAYRLLDRERVDAVLLDLGLPDVLGDALYHAIVRRWPALRGRVVLMSGELFPDDADPETPRLAKPFTVDALRAVLARVLEPPTRPLRVEDGRR